MDSQIPSSLKNLQVDTLGMPKIASPLQHKSNYIEHNDRIIIDPSLPQMDTSSTFEVAGPRSKVFFDGSQITCGIVTCGGLCPGINNVIRTIVMTLREQYKVPKILGFRYGYQGLSATPLEEPMDLTPQKVENIHNQGGTMLGSSRGKQDINEMVDVLVQKNVSILFVIGGDGTLNGAHKMVEEIKRRNLLISVIGIPKTIDNDIVGISQTFGFSSAVSIAEEVISCAHYEALSAWNGIGLVKLMGRDSGFVAAYAALANNDVNFCFVPEDSLVLEGENGLFKVLERRLAKKRHAVIVVAEGAGQHLFNESQTQRDASGNILHKDIGIFLRDKINEHFSTKNIPITLKYIDPSYTIRSVGANSEDATFCLMLGQNAVHAGMSGRTGLFIGYWNQTFTHVPFEMAINKRKKIDTKSSLWNILQETIAYNGRRG